MISNKAILLSLSLPRIISAQTACNKGSGYDIYFKGDCPLENFRNAFEETIFNNPLRTPSGCLNNVNEELAGLFGVAPDGLEEAVKEVCRTAQEAKPVVYVVFYYFLNV